jgi:hypothetical protein
LPLSDGVEIGRQLFYQVSGLGVGYLCGVVVLGVEFGIEDVFSDDDAGCVEDPIEDVDVVGDLGEIVFHQVESEVGHCLRNHPQELDGLLGQPVEAVVAKPFPVGLAQVEQVVLAERTPLLHVSRYRLEDIAGLCSNQRVKGALLLHFPTPLQLILLVKQVFLRDVDLALGQGVVLLFPDDWEFDLEEVIFLPLLFAAVLAEHLHLLDFLAGERGLDLLAHLLADDRQRLDDDLQVLGGQQLVDDDVLGQLLVVVFGLEYFNDGLERVDVVVLGDDAGVGGADVALGRFKSEVEFSGVSVLEVLAEVVLGVDADGMRFFAVVDAVLLRLHASDVLLHLPVEDLVVGG